MNADEIIEVVAGFKVGRKVRRRRIDGGGAWSEPIAAPQWDFTRFEFRLEQEPVPPGDLTWEEAEALRKQGVPLQFWSANFPAGWRERPASWGGLCPDNAYRRTPPKPAPRMVPLGQLDVWSGDMIRTTDDPECFRAVLWTNPQEVCFASALDQPFLAFYAELQRDCEISRDGGATWARCEKEAK